MSMFNITELRQNNGKTVKTSLQLLARLRGEMKKQPDSTPLIRRLREGDARRDE